MVRYRSAPKRKFLFPLCASDKGAATVWVAGLIVLLLMVTTLVLAFGTAVLTRHRANNAADIAALTAAHFAYSGEEVACEQAGKVVHAVNVQLISCRLHQGDAFVEVRRSLPIPLGNLATIVARARAGFYVDEVVS